MDEDQHRKTVVIKSTTDNQIHVAMNIMNYVCMYPYTGATISYIATYVKESL